VRRTQYDKQESRHLEAHQREQSLRTRHYAPYSPGGGTTAHSVLTAHNKPVPTTHIVQEEILQHSALTHKPVRHRCCSTPCGGCVHTPAAGRRLCPPECSRSPRWCGRTPRRWVAHTRPLITMGSARTHHPLTLPIHNTMVRRGRCFGTLFPYPHLQHPPTTPPYPNLNPYGITPALAHSASAGHSTGLHA
jgi:hypothetical protein